VQKWWSLLFAALLIGGVGIFVVAPFVPGWWLQKNVSAWGDRVDGLFYLILGITGFFFILTEAILVYFVYTYAAGPGRREHVFGHHYAEERVLWTSFFKRIARPVTAIIHDQHRLELTWTIIPAGILLFIAIAQIGAWEEIKYVSRMPEPGKETQQMEVDARQFEWRVRYPSPERMAEWEADPGRANDFATNPHVDDVWAVNEIHCWWNNKVLVSLKTRDVIHSFYLPNLRLKQDALPGKTIPVWFKATEPNTVQEGDRSMDGVVFQLERNAKGEITAVTPQKDDQGHWKTSPEQVWELACAELCGWGHYKMTGKLYVHKDKADFLAWLRHARDEQFRTQPSQTITTAAR
jgi:cytochrome c oxidase subunit 2